MAFHLGSVVATGVAAFAYAAIIVPVSNAYKTWKHDPARERVYRRNLFGRWVPDLWVKRAERSLWSSYALFWAAGLFILWEIMTPR